MKIYLESELYKRVERNLAFANIKINKQVALCAIETVNSKTSLTTELIKEVMKLGKL